MKRVVLPIIIVFILSVSVFASEITDDYMDIAKNYFNEENYLKAKEYTDIVIQLEPNNEKAESFKRITSDEDDIDNSDKTVEISVSPIIDIVYEDYSSVFNNQGVGYFNEEKLSEALNYFKKAISCNNRNYIAYYNLGLYYKNDGKISFAKYYLDKAYRINPSFTQSLVLLSDFESGVKKIDLLYKAANNGNVDANFYLGNYYLVNDNIAAAIDYYQKALSLEPNLAEAYLKLGRCFYEIRNYDSAIDNLKTYLTYVCNNDYAHFLLAKSYFKLRYETKAVEELKKALEINRNSEYLFEYARVLYSIDKFDKSVQILTELISKEQLPIYYNQLGLCYFEKEDIEKALENFQKALSLDNLSATIYFNIFRCYNILGKNEIAEEYINKAKMIVPENARQYRDLAIMYYKLSEPELAFKTIDEGIKCFSNDENLYKVKLKLSELIGNCSEYEKTKK